MLLRPRGIGRWSMFGPVRRRGVRSADATAERTDLVSQLKELAALKDQGVLSPEEFQAAKDKLLAP